MKPQQIPAVERLLNEAIESAVIAMARYPAPNYTATKVAEEAGEVVKAAVHCLEGRDTPEHVREEIVQAIGTMIRLYVEGDGVLGLDAIEPRVNK